MVAASTIALGAAAIIVGVPIGYMTLDRARDVRDLTDDPSEFRLIKMRPMELLNARARKPLVPKRARREIDKFFSGD